MRCALCAVHCLWMDYWTEIYLQAVRDGDLKIIPEMFTKTWYQWLENSRSVAQTDRTMKHCSSCLDVYLFSFTYVFVVLLAFMFL